MQDQQSDELQPDGAQECPTMAPNATSSAAQGKKPANAKKPAQQHNKKGKHGHDHKQDGANKAIKSSRTTTKAVVVRSPKSPDKIPIERDPQTPDTPGHDQEAGQQANPPVAAEAAGQPTAMGRMARRISMSMPSMRKQELSNLTKQGKPGPNTITAGETSEVLVLSSHMPCDSSKSRRKSSVRFGATTLQSFTPINLARSLSADGYQCWRATVLIGLIVMVTSLSVAVTIYALRSRKSAMKYCASMECKLAVEDLTSLLDHQIKPCDDFYQHVCGRPGDKAFGGASLTARALEDLLAYVRRLLLKQDEKDLKKEPGVVQLATTFSACYFFATSPKPLDEASLAAAVANDTDILPANDFVSVLRRVVLLSLHRGISTLFRAGVVTYIGDVALYVSRGKSLSEKLAKRIDGTSMQEIVLRLFEGAFGNTPMVRNLDANATVARLLEFDKSLRPESRYATDEEMEGIKKKEFMEQYIGGRDWMGFVNSLLPSTSHLTERSLVLVSDADMIKMPVKELRKDINLGAIYILLHLAAEIGRFYTIPLGQVTKACLGMVQEVLPPVMSNVFNNLTAREPSDPSRAGAVFFRVRKVFAKHPLKQDMREEDKKSVDSFLSNLNLHVHRTAIGIWPNGSGWRPNETTDASFVAFPRMHSVLKVREARRRLSDPPSLGQTTVTRDLLATDAAYSRPLNEIFLPPSLRRQPALYSGEVPIEFNMGTVGVLLAMQMGRASEASQNGNQEWYNKNIGTFGRCAKQSMAKTIASQIDALPANRLNELFVRTYSLRVVHDALSSYYNVHRYASNFKAVWKEVQRILFRRFCLLSCGDSERINEIDASSQLDCLVPVLSMTEFYEAFECSGVEAAAMGKCASLS